MTATLLLSLLCLCLAAGGFFFWKRAQKYAAERELAATERDTTRQHLSSLEERFRPVVDADAEAKRIVEAATTERTQLLDTANAERARIVQDLADTKGRLTQSIEELTQKQQ